MKENHDAVLASLDVRDAFLTMLQEKPTLVHTTDAKWCDQKLCSGEGTSRPARWLTFVVQGHHCFSEKEFVTTLPSR
jgi:hypothetical protein